MFATNLKEQLVVSDLSFYRPGFVMRLSADFSRRHLMADEPRYFSWMKTDHPFLILKTFGPKNELALGISCSSHYCTRRKNVPITDSGNPRIQIHVSRRWCHECQSFPNGAIVKIIRNLEFMRGAKMPKHTHVAFDEFAIIENRWLTPYSGNPDEHELSNDSMERIRKTFAKEILQAEARARAVSGWASYFQTPVGGHHGSRARSRSPTLSNASTLDASSISSSETLVDEPSKLSGTRTWVDVVTGRNSNSPESSRDAVWSSTWNPNNWKKPISKSPTTQVQQPQHVPPARSVSGRRYKNANAITGISTVTVTAPPPRVAHRVQQLRGRAQPRLKANLGSIVEKSNKGS